jgi:hypothetical protein
MDIHNYQRQLERQIELVKEDTKISKKNKDSRLVREFMAVSGRACHIDIKQISTHDDLLSYMLKYVSANKDDFASIENIALYIKESYKKRLITTFGIFYKIKLEKIPSTCYKCGEKFEIKEILSLNPESRENKVYIKNRAFF